MCDFFIGVLQGVISELVVYYLIKFLEEQHPLKKIIIGTI